MSLSNSPPLMLRMGTFCSVSQRQDLGKAAALLGRTIAFEPEPIEMAPIGLQRFEHGTSAVDQFTHAGLFQWTLIAQIPRMNGLPMKIRAIAKSASSATNNLFFKAPGRALAAVFQHNAHFLELIANLVGQGPLLDGAQFGADLDQQIDKGLDVHSRQRPQATAPSSVTPRTPASSRKRALGCLEEWAGHALVACGVDGLDQFEKRGQGRCWC